MKFLLLLFLLVSSVFSLSINESLLKIHSVLVPKLYLMEYNFEDALQNNTIEIALVYKDTEYKKAKLLKKYIDAKYAKGIRTYKVASTLVAYTDVDSSQANIYYLFPSNKVDIKKAIQQASLMQALTFSYSSDDLKYGVMISVNVGNKVKPILNLSAIQMSTVSFRPMLIKISNIYKVKPISYKLNFLYLNANEMYRV